MTRYYRAILTAALVGGLSMPAFAQTPAPPAPPAAAAPAAPQATPAPTAPEAAPKAPEAKSTVHKHHHVTKHKVATKEATAPGATQKK